MSRDELRSPALALAVDERAALARELIASLNGPADPDAEAAWVAELDKRAREMASGSVELVDWEDARDRILRRLRERGT